MLVGSDLLSMAELTAGAIEALLDGADLLKDAQRLRLAHLLLPQRTLAMIFEKPSLRTRATFEAGMTQLGGHAIDLAREHLQMGVRETVEDVGRNLSRWADAVMARVFEHSTLERLAASCSIPVVNGLSDRGHPCQILADLMTIREHKGRLAGLKVAYVGDGFNVAHSLLEAAPRLGMSLVLACPTGFEPDPAIFRDACASVDGGVVDLVHDSVKAVEGADAVYTDTWVSMGQEDEAEERIAAFTPYRVDAKLMSAAKPDAVFMHCLPAHRGQEVTDEVMDGPQSVVFDQAENRLHVQKSLLIHLIRGPDAFKELGKRATLRGRRRTFE